MHYLVDGYNLMFVWRRQDDSAGGTLEERRRALVELLVRFSRAVDRRVAVVFDGAGEFDWAERRTQVGPVVVTYSHSAGEADTVIIERLGRSTAGRHLAVVSDDRRIRDAVRRKRATSIRCEAFLKEVARALSRRRDAEPPEKFRGLSDEEARAWMRIMGFEESSPDGGSKERD